MTSRKILPVFIFICAISCVARAATYSWNDQATGCDCNDASVGTLTSTDYDQSQAAQDAAWTSFKAAYPGVVDADRLGNRTDRYNCHSYAYGASGKWLNGGQLSKYKGTASGCWEVDAAGSIKSDYGHSCLTQNNTGKCGSLFLCKNNQNIYGVSMPTTKYKKN